MKMRRILMMMKMRRKKKNKKKMRFYRWREKKMTKMNSRIK